MSRDPVNLLSQLWKRRVIARRGFRNRRISRRSRRSWSRNRRYPWRPRVLPTRILPSRPSGSEICRTHPKVFRIQDEPGRVVCLRRTSQELLKQLESVGGFLRRYVAVNQSEALGFKDLTSFSNDEPQTPSAAESPQDMPKLATPTKHRSKRKADNSASNSQRPKRSLPASPGTVIRGSCLRRGTIADDTNLHRLCTECPATTRLSANKFPRYINEVICRDKDNECAAKMGTCFQRQLQLSFLQFDDKYELDDKLSNIAGKTVYSEVWEQYTQSIRSCCECQMYPFIYRAIASRGSGYSSGEEDEGM